MLFDFITCIIDPGTAILIAGGASLFSGIASFFGGRKSSSDSLKATRETNAMNYQIWQEQRDLAQWELKQQQAYDYDMWNRQNEYNSPEQQIARLREAGLNPYLAMQGSNSTGIASSHPTSSQGQLPAAPHMQIPSDMAFQNPWTNGISSALATMQGLVSNIAQSQQIGQNSEQFPILLEGLKTQNQGLKIDNTTKSYVRDLTKMQYLYDVATFENRVGLTQVQRQYIQGQYDLIKGQKVLQNLSIRQQAILTAVLPESVRVETMTKWQNYYNMYRDGQIKLADLRSRLLQDLKTCAEIQNIQADSQLKGSQTSLNYKQGEKIDEEIEGIKLDNKATGVNVRILEETVDGVIASMNAVNAYQEIDAKTSYNSLYPHYNIQEGDDWYNRLYRSFGAGMKMILQHGVGSIFNFGK